MTGEPDGGRLAPPCQAAFALLRRQSLLIQLRVVDVAAICKTTTESSKCKALQHHANSPKYHYRNTVGNCSKPYQTLEYFRVLEHPPLQMSSVNSSSV